MVKNKTFRGGAHPREEKHWTEHKAIQNLPLPEHTVNEEVPL